MIIPKNWSSFQHYKNRSPAWIKLHRGILDDYDFASLPLASRALAPLLWLLASEYDGGKITASADALAFRLRTSRQDFLDALKPLIDSGFFASDSDVLAPCKQAAIPEERREIQEKIEEEIDIGAVASATRPNVGKIFDEEFWKVYPKREGANPKAPARKVFLTAVKSGHDPTAIVGGAERYATSLANVNQIGTCYVAQAVTWLRQARWDDYPPGTPDEIHTRRQPYEANRTIGQRRNGITAAIDGIIERISGEADGSGDQCEAPLRLLPSG